MKRNPEKSVGEFHYSSFFFVYVFENIPFVNLLSVLVEEAGELLECNILFLPKLKLAVCNLTDESEFRDCFVLPFHFR